MFPIEAGDFALRPYEISDLAAVHAAGQESLDTVGLWMSWCHGGMTEMDVAEWFELCDVNRAAGLAFDFGIFSADGAEYLGGIGINRIDKLNLFGNLGYWVRQSRQGEGIAPRVVHAIADFGFHELGLMRLEIVAAEGNLSSRRVAEKVGAAFECVARNRLMVQGRTTAAAVYSLIPD